MSTLPLETTGVTHTTFHASYSPLTTSIQTTVQYLLEWQSYFSTVTVSVKESHYCILNKFQRLYQITLHHIMHTNHPTNQQPAHTHSALATLVFLSILSSSKTNKNKTNLTTAYLLKNDGWLNCGLIE